MEDTIDFIDITDTDFDISSYMDKLAHNECGAVSIFIGTSRSTSRITDKKVVALDYEAYGTMALKRMKEICDSLRGKWKLGNITLIHRTGYVPVGQPGLFVGISSAHRQEGLQSLDFAIQQIKAKVPIWKQEVYEDQTREWTTNCECFWHSHK